MLRKFIGSVAFILVAMGSMGGAKAACASLTLITNGTTADATPVWNNFQALNSCAATVASPSFTGNVGIGMTAANILDITQTQNAGSFGSILNASNGTGAKAGWQAVNNTGSYVYTQVLSSGFATDGVLTAGSGAVLANGNLALVALSGSLKFAANGTAEAGRIGTDGSLLWGTTTNGGWLGNARGSFVSGASKDTLSLYNAATSGQTVLDVRVDNAAVNFAQFYFSTGTVGSIVTNGTSTSYNTTSDERLKDVEKPQRDYREVIKSLWVGDFVWKKNKISDFGILAQQAYPLFPSAISKPSSGSQYWEADYGKLSPLALWGVKDLYKTSAGQDQKIQALQAEVMMLKAQLRKFQQVRATDVDRAERLEGSVALLQRRLGVQTAQK